MNDLASSCRRLLRPFAPEETAYYLTACDQPAFVWYRVAKVATRSILTHFKANNLPLRNGKIPKGAAGPDSFPAQFRFAFVRNPWDRLVSCWQDKVVTSPKAWLFRDSLDRLQTFEGFVDYIAGQDLETCDRHYRLQARLIDLNRIHFLGRLERFAPDFAYVCTRLGLPGEPARINASPGKRDYRTYYTDALAEKVAASYRLDIALFGYAFDRPEAAP